MTKKIWTTFNFHSPKSEKLPICSKIRLQAQRSRLQQHCTISYNPQHQPGYKNNEKKWNIQIYVQDRPQSLCRTDKSQLKIKILGTHRYIKNSDPHSAYALHILNCRHEYGYIDDPMTLLKQINTPTLLHPVLPP